MRTAVIAIAITLLAVLAAVLYHLRTVDSWADRLRAEQRAHEQTRAELTAPRAQSLRLWTVRRTPGRRWRGL